LSDSASRLVSIPTQEWFTSARLVDGQTNLLLAVRVPLASKLDATVASANVEGPFRFARVFPDDSTKSQDVIEPIWARRRDRATESNVHLHVDWSQLHWCRVWYQSPLTEYHCRICFFDTQPPSDGRGLETFWFYAAADHPLLEGLRPVDGTAYSKSVPVPISDHLATISPTPRS
jgi:hypothetical protein